MSFDLGFIKAISSGPTAPVNTQMLWFDTNVNLHKYYDVGGTAWVALASGAASWSTVLASGAETLGQSPIISPGDAILFENGGFQVSLEPGVLTGNHTAQFQDASGVIAYLSDIASAGDLNATLVAGPNTGGEDIVMTTGDVIKASAGNAFIDMHDSSPGNALFFGVARAKMYSPTYVALESGVLVTMKTTAGPMNAATSTGFGFNTASPASKMHFETIMTNSGITNPDVFKIANGSNIQTHFGLNTDGGAGFGYIQTFAGGASWLALQPDGEGVSIAMGTGNPQQGGSDIYLGIGDPTTVGTRSMAIYTNVSSAAYFRTFTGLSGTKVMEFGHDSGETGIISNYGVGESISLRATQTINPVEVAAIRGDELAFEMSREWTVGIPRLTAIVPHPGGILGASEVDALVVAHLQYSTSGTFTGCAGYYGGRMLWLLNKSSSQTITLDHNNVFSAGDAQFFCPGNVDLVLGPRESALLYYDVNVIGGNGGWIVIATPNT